MKTCAALQPGILFYCVVMMMMAAFSIVVVFVVVTVMVAVKVVLLKCFLTFFSPIWNATMGYMSAHCCTAIDLGECTRPHALLLGFGHRPAERPALPTIAQFATGAHT